MFDSMGIISTACEVIIVCAMVVIVFSMLAVVALLRGSGLYYVKLTKKQIERLGRPRMEVIHTRIKPILSEVENYWLRELPPILNAGRRDAHDVHIKVILHPDDRIQRVEDYGDFVVVGGGDPDSSFIEFQRSILPPNYIPSMPHIVTGRKEIKRIETWCSEQKKVTTFSE